MIEIVAIILAFVLGAAVGIMGGAGVVARRVRSIAHDVIATLPADQSVARAAIGELLTRLDDRIGR